MTVWKHSVSWSKFKAGLDCPLQLQNTIDKVPHGFSSSETYYQSLGKLVQLVFELYYNQEINLKPGGQSDLVIMKAFDKILKAGYLERMKVSYPHTKTEDDLKEAAKVHILNGFRIMQKIGMLKVRIRSEVKWNSVFRGFRMFGMIDFIRESKKGTWIWDGKGHAKKNADPMQVVYYALAIAASGHTIAGGGLLYWQHDYEPIDVSPKAMRDFIDGPFTQVRPLFEELKGGTSRAFPATPSEKVCGSCNWRNTCPFSVARMKPLPMQTGLPDQVGFGELPARV